MLLFCNMIKLFIYENQNSLNSIFQEDDYNIPFLGGTLLEFVYSSFERFSSYVNQDFEAYVPVNWDVGLKTYDNIPSNLTEDYDCIFILDLFKIPLKDFSVEDYHFLIQNKDNLFSHSSGIKMGCINNKTNISKLNQEDIEGFNGVVSLDHTNFLFLNRSLIPNILVENNEFYPEFYGDPFILCDRKNIHSSKICGPCFIGEDVQIINSVIYPGTIIIGNSVIKNSKIFESFICESSVSNSEMSNSLLAVSNIEDLDIKNSILPRGSVILDAGKR